VAVVVESGDWTTSDAAGKLYLTEVVGTFAAEAITSSGSGLAACLGGQTLNTLPPGGYYECIEHNFYGSTGSAAIYGCNGVGSAFMFNGGFAPILTGMVVDKPTHIFAHRLHLFLSYPGGSVQHSAPGKPMSWDVVAGAGEIGIGNEITGFAQAVGGVLVIFGRTSTHLLFGTSSVDWDLRVHSDESGAIERTIQAVGSAKYLDDTGIISLDAVQEYGDFSGSPVGRKINPFVKLKSVTASMRASDKGQYRLFFSDGSGLYGTFVGNQLLGWTTVLFPVAVEVAWGDKGALFFGDENGIVYQFAGPSFDGAEVPAYLKLPYNHMKNPSVKKRYRKFVIEVDTESSFQVGFQFEFDYGTSNQPAPQEQMSGVGAGKAMWGVGVWGLFVWGQNQHTGTASAYIDGSGKNMSALLRTSLTYEDPYTIQSAIIHYSYRGLSR